MSSLIERARFAYRTSHGAPSILQELADALEAAEKALSLAEDEDYNLTQPTVKAIQVALEAIGK